VSNGRSVRALLPARCLNEEMTALRGRDVVKIEALPIAAGQHLALAFEAVASPWRQGIWLATNGSLRVLEESSPQMLIWADTAPPEVVILCEQTAGLLHFYNVWSSGRKPGHERLSRTSGMIVDRIDDTYVRYSCNDIGFDSDFNKLIFRLAIEGPRDSE
jgi:hypothetical protein